MKVLMILGMHRSGTSCLAGSLQQNGVYLGNVHTYNPHNTKGNRENQAIVDLNDAVLAANQSNWNSPPSTELKWDELLIKRRSIIVSRMDDTASNSHYSYWGFKDPRTLLTLPFWQDTPMKITFVGTFRHPLSVAASLNKRSGMPIEAGIALWDAYNSILLKVVEAHQAPLVCFDIPNEQYLTNLVYLYQNLSLNNTDQNTLFFDNKLRTNKKILINHPLSKKTESLYQRLLSIHKSQAVTLHT